jgi:hypothetical protein
MKLLMEEIFMEEMFFQDGIHLLKMDLWLISMTFLILMI